MDAQNPKRWHPKLLRGPEGWTVGMVPAKHGDWLRASDMPAAPDMAELVEALRNIAAQKKTTELETEYDVECADFEGGYDAIIDVARTALAKIKEPQP